MSIQVALYHRTHYRYARKARLAPQVIRLRPAPHCRTNILSYSLRVSGGDHFRNWMQDPQGNYLARIVFPEPVPEFKVEVDLVAEMAVLNPFDFFLEDYAKEFPFIYEPSLREELEPFLGQPLGTGRKFAERLATIDRQPGSTIDFLVELNRQLQKEVHYLIRMEPGVQTPEETLAKESGSCRDSAWLLINLLRGLGLASRFASGYLIQLTADQESLDGPSGPPSDFTDLHAWAEVYLPGAGWIGLDPTSGLLAGEGHIPLACSPVPASASPITGMLEDVEAEFDFHMEIKRIYETPRVTKPYTEDAWAGLQSVGSKVDQDLESQDVRLTMGGEPTFVSIDDMDGPEWNVAAVGKDKRRLSGELLRRLWCRFAPGGFLHYGQGKWYPGESLPRWAYNCYWDPLGRSLWTRPDLLADPEKDYGIGSEEASRFLRKLAEVLEVGTRYIQPAYEDPWYFLWKEQKLPANVDPLDSRLRDPEERERLARVFDSGFDSPRGWVLPLQRWWQAKAQAPHWMSGPWFLRQKRLFLIPGDSPVGLRLPLESLPWMRPTNYPAVGISDPSAEALLPLADWESRFRHYLEAALRSDARPAAPEFGPRAQILADLPDPHREPEAGESASWVIRTALCVEPKEGRLYVFFPPVHSLDDFLDLLSAVEATACALNMPVCLEGEKPPVDGRLHHFSVTPDPGVIEVNIHPSRSWEELVAKTEGLYEEARLARLTTEKFMLDGRHTGTGGGNHFVLGAQTTLDSPFLRRPDLLRSLIAYWQAHPSLSYLFSGLFIGPTSQAPRIDEARNDALYEMEIAFREIEASGSSPAPWLVDRIFRNLLTDASGNTHRAEFCIDKLYSPDSLGGRRGLLELRSFEMPPHPRMSLAQQLLLRALVAWFWREPFSPRRLRRWHTALHDKFMLPHFVWEDFCEVLFDLRRAGYAFEERWFDPHFQFRFPLYGSVEYRSVKLELRHALEPWHVLGEEGFSGSTVRFVDSSVERLQLMVQGLDPERHLVCCNGRRVPLREVNKDASVAGVRFRAWQPPSCLHPTIASHAPLVFDLVDVWARQSVAGCTYYVAHPGGRNYEQYPVNGFEAESRRLARFEPFGHRPGTWDVLPEDRPHPEFPHTLDLRRLVEPL